MDITGERRVGFVIAALLAAGSAPSAEERLQQAKAFVEAVQYVKALKAVEAGLDQGATSHATLVGLYELGATLNAALDKGPAAEQFFALLLTIEPGYELSRDLPPRTRTLFFAAKNKVASQVLEPVVERPTPSTLVFKLPKRPLLVPTTAKLKATFRGEVIEAKSELVDGVATFKVPEGDVEWALELSSATGVLRVVSGRSIIETPKPVKSELTPPPPPPLKVTTVARPWAPATGIVLVSVAVAAAIAGGVTAGLSTDARSQLANAPRDQEGVITSITQQRAAQLDQSVTSFGVAAYALFGVAAAAGIVGVIVLAIGPGEELPVSLGLGLGQASLALAF